MSSRVIIDCNYLGHQARYTMKGLNYGDVGTGVLFGFMSRVLFFSSFFRTNKFIFCWDSRESKRKKIYPAYKANRNMLRKTPEELTELRLTFEQFDRLRNEILPEIGFRNNYTQDGYESDDLMAEIVMNSDRPAEDEFIIVSADEDLYQLLRHCRIYNPSSGKMMTTERFNKDFGISCDKWKMVKQIAGCSSDNIKGIQGVGNKTAIDYLNGVLSPGVKYRAIMDNQELIRFNEKLIVLPFEGTRPIQLLQDQFDVHRFIEICDKYGFESFLRKSKFKEWSNLFEGVSAKRALIKLRGGDDDHAG